VPRAATCRSSSSGGRSTRCWPAPTLEAAEDAFESGYPTAAALLQVARDSGHCTVYACSASAGLLGRRPDEIAAHVDQVVGWTAILGLTAGVIDRFYL
jgi:peroxiredoxin family protein